MNHLDETINQAFQPLTDALRQFIFYEITIFGASFPWIVMWLVVAAVFFTLYFNFINIRGFGHAISLLKGNHDKKEGSGEISHFQALTTAVSGTVGIGNIGGVAIVITIGGPGALFWLVVAGFLSMSTKFVECIAGVMYRKEHEDGSVSGGPMYYLEKGLRERGLGFAAKPLGYFYALAIVIGCLGIGNMFQSNQAFEQFVYVTGGEASYFLDKGWMFGLVMILFVGIVIIGGIKGIARVTSRLVPFMAVLYIFCALIIILMNYQNILPALSSVVTNAFAPQAVQGGVIGVIILGFQRAVFSNEAGIGSAPIAHSAVKTNEPVTQGYVALLEPFIDTVVICSISALVILTTVYEPGMTGNGVKGIELTSSAFAENLSWSVIPLSFVAILFAYSTIIAWSYYGLKGWTYLFGQGRWMKTLFLLTFCFFVGLGCSIKLDTILDFSDAMVFLVALPNIIGLYILAPVVKKAVIAYQKKTFGGG